MRNAFTITNMETFTRNLISGQEKLRPYKTLNNLDSVKAWDGKKP